VRIAIAFDCLFPLSIGGGERQYAQFAREFAAAGHEVVYLTRRQWDGPPPAVEGMRVVAVSDDRELYDAAGGRTLGPALRFARGLFTHLRAHRRDYDAVLVSATPATNVPAVRAALAGSRVAVAVDWLEVWTPAQWREYSGPLVGRLAGAAQRLAVRLSPLATCHSRMVAGRLRALGLPGEPLVSPGLIADGPFGEAQLAPPSPPHVVYVGRHIPDKRVESIPAAVAHARRRLPGLTATIYGDGATREAVAGEVRRLGLEDVVALPGFVAQEELDRALPAASCLINPSCREGYGLVVVESCAVGTPVVLVAAPDNASVELVEDGVNGIVAPSTRAEDLGGAIAEVVEAGEPLRKATRAWFERARETRTIAATAAAILERLAVAPR
jgi:glycosyltransferase involved in cell wall biosynthesis